MSYLFTSTPSNNRQSTSQLFADYKNPNQIPGPVGSSGIIGLPVALSASIAYIRDRIHAVIYAVSTKKQVDALEPLNVANLPPIHADILDPPELVTSFDGKELRDKVQTVMSGIGFRKESSARFQYYKGPATPANVNTIVKEHGDLDTYAPYGVCNVRGYLCFVTMQKMVLGALTCLTRTWNNIDIDKYMDKDWQFLPEIAKAKITIKRHNDINFSGIFVPYFPGLLLPDKETPVEIFIRRFGLGLGKDTAEMCMNTKTIREGWKSLHTTPQGIILSHILFCFDLAFTIGARMYIYMPGGQYNGIILRGSRLNVMKSQTIYKSIGPEELMKLVGEFDQHDLKMGEILALVNPKLYPVDKSKYLVSSNITSPRMLHNILRQLSFGPDDMAVLHKAVGFLRYHQKLWEPTNSEDILAATNSIAGGEYLADHFPIIWKSEAFFSKNLVLSTLAAFGVQAPSLCGTGSNCTVPIHAKGPAIQEKMPGGIVLRGLPIFVKPLQIAAEDWSEMRRIGMVRYKVASLDKEQYTRVPAVSKYLPFDERETRSILFSLAPFSAKSKEAESRKRAREQEKNAEPDVQEARHKRMRTTAPNEEHSYVMGLLGQYEDPDVEME